MHTIDVTGIRLYAYHGCLPEETKIGGHYLVDVSIETNFTKAANEDSLEDTVDYVDVNRIVEEEMAIPSKLIEHVGQRIINRINSELKGVDGFRVKITKLCPPINGDVASVSITIQS